MNAQTISNISLKAASILGVICLVTLMAGAAQASEDYYFYSANGSASALPLFMQEAADAEGFAGAAPTVISMQDPIMEAMANPAFAENGAAALPLGLAGKIEPVSRPAMAQGNDNVWNIVSDSPAYGYGGPSSVGLGVRTLLENELNS